MISLSPPEIALFFVRRELVANSTLAGGERCERVSRRSANMSGWEIAGIVGGAPVLTGLRADKLVRYIKASSM